MSHALVVGDHFFGSPVSFCSEYTLALFIVMPLHTSWKGLADTIHPQTDSSRAYGGATSQALRCLHAIYGFAILDYIAFRDLFLYRQLAQHIFPLAGKSNQ